MEWRPIETAPRDGEMVLLFYPADSFEDYDCIIQGYWDASGHEFNHTWRCDFYGSTGDGATHWSEVPERPA